ncbi:hypothetical protein SUGI_0200040 [Cryptomeria japonica]|nr:hypothetical protein SUGI_0200040 [Cryptomeria japonica]
MTATASSISDAYNVEIVKRDVVLPAFHLEERLLSLSNLDLAIPPVSVHVFFCYNKPSDWTFESMISLLRNSLSSALVYYYVFAGELITNSAGEPELLCNNKGVEFTQAYSATALAQVGFYDPDRTVEGKLVPLLPNSSQGKGNPVFSVQVTEFSCGGIVVGCTFDHKIADAFSGNMFFTCWAKLSKNESIDSLIPSFTKSVLRPQDPPVLSDRVYVNQTPGGKCQQIEDPSLASRIYHLNAKNIEKIQACANEHGKKYSKLEAFCAYLWNLLVHLDSQEIKHYSIGIAVDGRPCLMKMGMPANYFGNVVAFAFAEAAADDIKNKPLSWSAKIIHEAIYTTARKEYFKSLIDLVERTKTTSVSHRITDGNPSSRPVVMVSSGLRFPLYGVDYGWGKPMFASYHFPKGSEGYYVMPFPSPVEDGSWIVYMHLPLYQLNFIGSYCSGILSPITKDHLDFVF